MKNVAIVLILVLLAGCTTHTEFGPCVGLGEDKNPNLVYRLSGWNLFLAIVGFEMILPPILVATDSTFCPIGNKEPTAPETPKGNTYSPSNRGF